jgi:hypothetical protein
MRCTPSFGSTAIQCASIMSSNSDRFNIAVWGPNPMRASSTADQYVLSERDTTITSICSCGQSSWSARPPHGDASAIAYSSSRSHAASSPA